MTTETNVINEEKINEILKATINPDARHVRAVLDKAKEKKGLELEDVGCLVNLSGPDLLKELFETAGKIKNEIYGERIVFFAPLYVSNYCVNDCDYCNFHASNKALPRKKLDFDEIKQQIEFLLNAGHKRVLVEFGEDPAQNTIDYVCKIIEKIYSIKTDKGSIRRINVNISATGAEDYRKLKSSKIGTYQIFQETYHKKTYEMVHHGPKADYERQITAHCRAFEAGIDDFGVGVLFGLYDWRYEVLALVSHAQYMEKKYGVGPHTISVPRFCPAQTVTYKPEYPVSDNDFLKLIAVLRMAVPYTGMIISTRERPEIRKKAFKLGISQASAGSVTTPGGYGKEDSRDFQFQLHDRRPLAEVIENILEDKYLPSFCTACYRSGRTGEAFMALSKPGEIHDLCRPNGLLTFAEYLEDFADAGLYEKGQKIIKLYLGKIENNAIREKTQQCLSRIKEGKRDLYL
ncbi:MAG: [FeFe] hydrogenase H-cluster radical SAM maturase HydG [Elusimicrobia bacterium RIFOXYB2_FULL_48_7]|nr:MAG: [FeFe] hydrogenase H-cluster radical SAM maturase HydG [Elusimicrobia bacterium RIFOXYB2_FULL_48_7]